MVSRRRRRLKDDEYTLLLSGSQLRSVRTVAPVKPEFIKSASNLPHINEWVYLLGPGTDNRLYLDSPDHEIPWTDVAFVVADLDISDIDRCPVCLESPPIAPLLSKCGHIFCMACLSKYVELSKSDKCPICQKGLYAVCLVIYPRKDREPEVKIGQEVVFDLYMRTKSGLTITKCEDTKTCYPHQLYRWDPKGPPISSRVFLADSSIILDYLNEDLEKLKESNEDEYFDSAIKQMEQEIARLKGWRTTYDSTKLEMEDPYYYFYQLHNRPRSYLSSLDIKILLHEYKHFRNFPTTCTPKVQNITLRRIDKTARSRYRYLDNLPLGTTIREIECEWTDVVSRETLEVFKEELDKRLQPNDIDGTIDTETYDTGTCETYESHDTEWQYDYEVGGGVVNWRGGRR